MNNLDAFADGTESIFDLQQAARIGRGDDARAGFAQMAELALLQPGGGARLGKVIDTRAPAAPRGFGTFAQFKAGNRAQNLAWL